jgi:23S rRNA (adenine2503-C2)-methyltransferase
MLRHPPHHIFALSPDALRTWCQDRRMPAFRAAQILEWVYAKGVTDPEKMSNLSKLDRAALSRDMTFESGEVLRHQLATDGTQKLLVQWTDFDPDAKPTPHAAPHAAPESAPTESPSTSIALPQASSSIAGDSSRQTECVVIPSLPQPDSDDAEGEYEPDRFTACISSQVGCPVRCKFCASGLTGLDHNLSAGRIVEQVYRLSRLPGVRRISNVVFMGMGEPLSNLAAVVPAVRTLAAPHESGGMGISARKITISTVGLPKAIEKLAEQLDLPVTLALSLHAPTDELRRQLIPWSEYTTIKELLASCQAWFERTGREITLEYTLLHNVNDRPEHAEELARLAKTLRANVNIIRYNEVAGLPFERPRTDAVRGFQEVLRSRRINAHIRASRGRDIAAACGQLRHENKKTPPAPIPT